MRPEAHRPRYAALAAIFAASLAAGCTDPVTPENGRSKEAEGWYQRARRDFKQADFAEAHDSINKALGYAKDDPEVRTLAAEVSIALLDYAEVLRLLKGVRSTDAARLRGRAYWYKGDLEAAADELDTMLNDPDVKDDWAKATSRLARGGLGRTPFSLSGGMLAAVEMVHVSPVAPWFVVPVEIDGESALAMIATNTAEVVIDSAARPEPSWVSLRFGDHFEVKDVPALPQDLSGISKELQAPIKALLGVNLLRHLNATIDFSGRQFVARSFAPPPPPSATRIDLFYVRGGGLVVRGTLGGEKGPPAALMVDTSKAFPIALDLDGWKKIGVDATQLKLIPGDPEQKLREGVVPLLRLGAFDMPRVSGLYGLQMADLARAMQIDLDGIVGAGLLYPYRCTFADGGRLLWLEDDSDLQQVLGASQPAPAPAPAPAATPAPPPAPTNQRELPPAAGPGLRLDQPPSPAPAPAPKK